MLKPIPGFPDYFASEDGNIWTIKPRGNSHVKPTQPVPMKKCLTGGGKRPYRYFTVPLIVNKKRIRMKVATLILISFVSPRPAGMWCLHGIKGQYCDSLDNLYWGTQEQNFRDKIRDGTNCLGEKNSSHKLNLLQVRIIRKAYRWRGINGLGYDSLAEIFHVSKQTIHNLINGKTHY